MCPVAALILPERMLIATESAVLLVALSSLTRPALLLLLLLLPPGSQLSVCPAWPHAPALPSGRIGAARYSEAYKVPGMLTHPVAKGAPGTMQSWQAHHMSCVLQRGKMAQLPPALGG